jgi:hypothetical protein
MLVISKIRRWLYEKKIRRLHFRHRSQNSSTYTTIDAIVERFRDAGGLKHDYQSYKLFCLGELLNQYRPTSILELGSGSSTAIFAEYIKEYGGSIHSIDETESWLNNARALAGIDEDDKRFIMQTFSRRIGELHHKPSVGYGLNAERTYDLVFVDGPSLRIDGVRRKDAINDDVFRLVDRFPPRIIVVDGRQATANELAKYIKGRYTVELSELMDGSLEDNYRYFSIFHRN